MNYQIRRAIHQDAANIISAHRRSIREVCSNDYQPTQIAIWSERNFKEERWCQTMDKDLVWVISNDTQDIFGFGHLSFAGEKNTAEIAGLYFVPEVIGLGLGKKLIQTMIDECKKKNTHLVILSATKTAKHFYEKCGFTQLGNVDTIQIGGTPIECFNMEMHL